MGMQVSGKIECCGLPLSEMTGVMKSVMGEVLDTTNRAKGFALLPVVWSFGSSVA